MLTSNQTLLSTAEQYFQEFVQPQASLIDHNTDALLTALQGMGDRRLLALRVPQQWGGAGIDDLTYRQFQILIARYSGVLTFLQTQHQSAGSQLSKSPNEGLKKAFLPSMATGNILVGVGYSHLRRIDNPPLNAIPVSGGYQLTGTIPWLTGWNFFQWVIVGAILPTQEALYGILPFKESQQPSGGSISFDPPMALAAMQPSNTVSATLDRWLLKPEQIVNIKPLSTLTEQDRQNVLHHGFYAIGCAEAGLKVLYDMSQRRGKSFVLEIYQTLADQVEACRRQMLLTSSNTDISYEKRLNLRTQAINLAGRCSWAAVIAASGAANSLSHPAQRIYREALMFSVFGQTTDVMESTLRQLMQT